MGFAMTLIAVLIVGYPIHGGVMYGDPWAWIFKEGSNENDDAF